MASLSPSVSTWQEVQASAFINIIGRGQWGSKWPCSEEFLQEGGHLGGKSAARRPPLSLHLARRRADMIVEALKPAMPPV